MGRRWHDSFSYLSPHDPSTTSLCEFGEDDLHTCRSRDESLDDFGSCGEIPSSGRPTTPRSVLLEDHLDDAHTVLSPAASLGVAPSLLPDTPASSVAPASKERTVLYSPQGALGQRKSCSSALFASKAAVAPTPCSDWLQNLKFSDFSRSHMLPVQVRREIDHFLEKGTNREKVSEVFRAIASGDLTDFIVDNLVERHLLSVGDGGADQRKSAALKKIRDNKRAAFRKKSGSFRYGTKAVVREAGRKMSRHQSRKDSRNQSVSEVHLERAFSSPAAIETVNRMIVEYLCEAQNGPDWVVFNILKYVLFDTAKTLEHLAKCVVW